MQALLDVLPADQIKPYLVRLFKMGEAVQGGMTSRRNQPDALPPHPSVESMRAAITALREGG